MKTILALILALSVGVGPALAWSWGEVDGDCPYSKRKVEQEKSEQVEESEQ